MVNITYGLITSGSTWNDVEINSMGTVSTRLNFTLRPWSSLVVAVWAFWVSSSFGFLSSASASNGRPAGFLVLFRRLSCLS
jgi:hypothetical protein